MDDENNGSQEEMSIPLTQDCFEYVWKDISVENGVTSSDTKQFFNEAEALNSLVSSTSEVQPQFGPHALNAAGTSTEYPLNIPHALQLPEVLTGVPGVPISSLPAINNWAGDWGFDVHFDKIDPCSNSSSWTYSQVKDKLYVKKDAPCPIKFVTTGHIPHGTTIRAMVVFTQAQFASEVVQRCFNHAQKDISSGVQLAHYLLRSECLQAMYDEDPVTNRHSVVVQYENPQRGAADSTYVYSFACWGSCCGGINRRPIKIIFTLELGGRVIGRRSIDLRICACPARDRLNDEKMTVLNEEKCESTKMAKRKQPNNEKDFVSSLFSLIHGSPNKKSKRSSTPPPGPYLIRVNDYNQYRFLKQMKNFLCMYSAMNNLAPQIKQFLLLSRVKSESSGEDRKTEEESE